MLMKLMLDTAGIAASINTFVVYPSSFISPGRAQAFELHPNETYVYGTHLLTTLLTSY